MFDDSIKQMQRAIRYVAVTRSKSALMRVSGHAAV